jgi:large subunit ribosomal protein L29
MAKKRKTKIEEIRKLSDADLSKELDESYRALFALRIKEETLQLANHREIPAVRHSIARLKTIQRQRELAREQGAAQ